MADDHQPNPRGYQPPSHDPNLTKGGNCGTSNLVEGLGDVVDDIRQIASDLGARPYTYHSIKVQWSGGEIGRGAPKVVSETEIKPTPQTRPVGFMSRDLDAGGAAERGDMTLTGISPRYTEDEIDELFGTSVEDGYEVFIEQRIDDRDGVTRRRRFMLAGAPERRATMADWKVTIRKADSDRERDGAVRPEREQVW